MERSVLNVLVRGHAVSATGGLSLVSRFDASVASDRNTLPGRRSTAR